jgi:hypothetical protein
MLNQLMDERRKIVLDHIYAECNGTVKYGPFTGMKILKTFAWGDGDTGGKLTGLYENELFDVIEQAIESKPDLVINYGCAEGFYGIGLAIRLPESKVVLFDIDQNALDVAKQNADSNQVTNIEYSRQCNHQYLEMLLSKASNPFIVMDCEGAEDIILDLWKIPSLSKTKLIVEMHDCLLAGITDRLIDKFNETHDLEGITQGNKNMHIEPLMSISDLDKLILINENRPCTMHWVHMVPKTDKE